MHDVDIHSFVVDDVRYSKFTLSIIVCQVYEITSQIDSRRLRRITSGLDPDTLDQVDNTILLIETDILVYSCRDDQTSLTEILSISDARLITSRATLLKSVTSVATPSEYLSPSDWRHWRFWERSKSKSMSISSRRVLSWKELRHTRRHVEIVISVVDNESSDLIWKLSVHSFDCI